MWPNITYLMLLLPSIVQPREIPIDKGRTDRAREISFLNECESGVREDGPCLGHNREGLYDFSDANHIHTFEKSRFYKTETCDSTSFVNPEEELCIHDLHVHTNRDTTDKQWLDPSTNVAPYRITSTVEPAHECPTIQWTDGKYYMAAIYDAFDNRVCIPLQLLKVPCGIRAPEINCICNKASDSSEDVPLQTISENSGAEKPRAKSDSANRLVVIRAVCDMVHVVLTMIRVYRWFHGLPPI
ncbi:hypothetical protein V8C35DRAFT_327185 [Trichoderma chlorosporum]